MEALAVGVTFGMFVLLVVVVMLVMANGARSSQAVRRAEAERQADGLWSVVFDSMDRRIAEQQRNEEQRR